jgi:hypothetical protein
MALFDRLASLPLEVERVELERRELPIVPEFTRVTTTVVLHGRGERGVGEDVTYAQPDHDDFPRPDLRGSTDLAGFSAHLDEVELWPHEPRMPAFRDYRRWAWESAALDLALRQSGLSLGAAVGREYRPVRFVVSTREDGRAYYPSLELKLDPTNDWDRPLMESLASTGRVRILDLKAYYQGTPVDVEPDPELYRNVVEVFPDAVLEDAALAGACGEALRGAEERLSFDAPIHSAEDVEALPLEPRWLNVKPSRFGTLRRLFDFLDFAQERGIRLYGGGQFELGPGRRQVQALASLFYADGPNDVAPSAYNEAGPRPGLPASPLPPPTDGAGF